MRLLLVTCLTVLALGCAATSLRSGSQCSAPERVAGYTSFAWVGAPANTAESTFITPATLEKLEAAIVDVLQLDGLTLEGAERADLLVGYRISTQEYVDPRGAMTAAGGRWSSYPPLPPLDPRYVEESRNDSSRPAAGAPLTYSEAYLAVEMIERATGEIVWRGWAEKEITLDDRADPGALARQAAQAVMQDFPRPEC